MKSIAVGVALMAGIVSSPLVSKGADVFVNDPDINLDTMKTPSTSLDDKDSMRSGVKPQDWLRIAFRFKTPKVKDGNTFKYEDDITVRVEALIPTEYRGKASYGLFTGEVTYLGVMLDGKEHWSRFFIPPYYLKRYLSEKDKITSAAVRKKIQLKVTVVDGSRKIIGLVYMDKGKVFENKDKEAAIIAQNLKRASEAGIAQVQKHDGKIWAVDKTPWKFSNYDSYEVIKPEEGRR